MSDGVIVDIGASTDSFLFWWNAKRRVMFEGDALACQRTVEKAKQLKVDCEVFNRKVYPDTVVATLKEACIPIDFDVLSLDIDSYDFWVLLSILKEFRPWIIVTEVNENIPPPISFTLKSDPKLTWNPGSAFFGYSIWALKPLLSEFGYRVSGMAFNNVILTRSDILSETGVSLEEAWEKGYLMSPAKTGYFSPEQRSILFSKVGNDEKLKIIRDVFRGNDGHYVLGVDKDVREL